MANGLVHTVETLESQLVRTAKQLQDALGAMQGPGREDRDLSETMIVDLLAETLSDGSVAYEVRIRKAPHRSDGRPMDRASIRHALKNI